MGFILSIILWALRPIATLATFIVVFFTHAKKRGYWRVINEYWFENALDGDIYSNHAYRTLWNLIFRNKHGYKFGVRGETISSALGKNQRDKTLTWFGWFMVGVLWVADLRWLWKKTRKNYIESGGHCLMSIKDN